MIRFAKKNMIRAGVLFSAGFVAMNNIQNQDGSFLNNNLFFEDESLVEGAPPQYYEKSKSLALAPVADADQLADYEQFLKEEGEKNTVVGGMMPVANPSVEEFNSGEQDVFVYKVEQGDTVSSIAQKYKISTSTILWANDLATDSIIKPGDEIFILPTTGVRYTVAKNDTIGGIAKKYKAKVEKIIEFNDLPANGELEEGEEIIIPDGVDKTKPSQNALQRLYASNNPNKNVPSATKTSTNLHKYPAHRFPYGWCTWYVASKRHVPWGGNAGTWLYHARAYGAATGKTPTVGSIIVTNESRWGHVGIVTGVKGNSISISEMNYKGWGIQSSRTISAKSPVIKGYIYVYD
jgi:surface antigen